MSITPPPVADIVTVYATLSALLSAETMKKAVLEPPEESWTMEGLVEKIGGCLAEGV
jgi:hypothetical protein